MPNDVLMVTRNGSPTEVLLFQTPSASLNGLWTTGFYASAVMAPFCSSSLRTSVVSSAIFMTLGRSIRYI